MNRKTVIVLITPGADVECWGSLIKACKAKDWNYLSLARKKLPYLHNGTIINRVDLK